MLNRFALLGLIVCLGAFSACGNSSASAPKAMVAANAEKPKPAENPLADFLPVPASTTYIKSILKDGKYLHWRTHAGPIYVTLESGADTPGWKPVYDTYARQAFATWQKVLKNRITFAYTPNPSLTDIVIRWKETSTGQEVGLTNSKGNANNFVISDIEMYTSIPHSSERLSDVDIQKTFLHEIGHALGFSDHSPDVNDIMYPVIQPGRDAVLSGQDIATMQTLYDHPADIINPSGIHQGQFRIYEHFYNAGSDALNAQKYARAFGFYQHASKAFPANGQARLMMGAAALYGKNLKVAQQILNPLRKRTDLDRPLLEICLGELELQFADHQFQQHAPQAGYAHLKQAILQFKTVQSDPAATTENKSQADRRMSDIRSYVGQFSRAG